MRPRSRHIDGFTLVEMMIVISIIAILAAVALPSFRTLIVNAQVRSTAEGLLTGLNLARTEAIRRNMTVTFWLVDGLAADCQLATTGTSWVVSVGNPAGLCNVAASETTAPRLIQNRAGSEVGNNITVTATGGSCLSFNGFGGVEAACPGGIDRLTSIDVDPPTGTSANERQIAIGGGGSVRLCDPHASGDSPALC